ncbi:MULTISPECIES: hypothetical protein [Vibrio harveyi group]|uniref:hypothetical protein n=1 Tax=Vibrio harveyi group TaxID=717610 RepID=UPI0004E61AAF|nr:MULTISPECIES: hypothetical protein [Vibrio harveyi group]KFE95994.1 hypothetical protein HB39_05270 [Vibrio parahaemolyticus]MBE4098156.1 hypothetical protein [Vibrio parahaemolyticus]MBE4132709.1 hypothetical protein [Vibrio parahaemolyticus]MBE4475239.1 hypothetical protein [Vibrio parahaemolyticus]MBT0080857.1 hypothetical protein [Vibrio alginolyticus]
MTSEKREFKEWMTFSNHRMSVWVVQYLQKKGIAEEGLVVDGKGERYPSKENIMKQASRYFSSLDTPEIRQRNLTKMKRAWDQRERRRNLEEKEHSVMVSHDTHSRLEQIKADNGLDNLGQSVKALIDDSAFKREILKLENTNISLRHKLEKLSNDKSKLRQQTSQLAEMQKRINVLEKQNASLIDAFGKLADYVGQKDT